MSVFGAVLASIGAWHTIVVVPIKSQIKDLLDISQANTGSIHSLEIDHTRLTVTLEALTKAIEKLSDKFEK